MTSTAERRRTFVVSKADMELFAAASRDVNPLHVSSEYARHTPFGEPVVFGVLAAIAAFANLHDRADAELASLSIEFRSPLFVGIEYLVEWAYEGEGRVVVRVRDLGKVALHAALEFRSAGPRALFDVAETNLRTAPSTLGLAELVPGFGISRSYAPSLSELEQLNEHWALAAKGFSASTVAALLWASYLVGMEMPGERATFWRLELELAARDRPPTLPLAFEATVKRSDARVSLVDIEASVTSGERMFASASITALVRSDSPRCDPAMLAQLLVGARRLDTKTAVVIGGSRGLGAAMVQALALQGANVILVYRDSAVAAERTRSALTMPHGVIDLIQGDASDARWCREHLLPFVGNRGGIDMLICTATPAIRPRPFVVESTDQLDAFLSESLRLVTSPLTACIETVVGCSGTVVVVSSDVIHTLPPELPHYVMAKAALEGLANWCAATYPAVRFVIARPPKLLTDQVNTLLGRVGATPVESVAAAMVRQLETPRSGVRAELFEPGARVW